MIERIDHTDEHPEEVISGVYLEMKEATVVRLLIGMQQFDQRRIFVQSMKQMMEFKHIPGCQPPGYVENQLSAALEHLAL